MNRLYLILTVFLLLNLSAFSQHTFEGKVVDSENKPLVNATVVLLNSADSIMKYFGISNKEGEFKVSGIRKGNYIMQCSFVGLETLYQDISFPKADGLDLGKIILKPSMLDEVQVIGEYVPIRFKNDTTEFNAKAFSTRPGAVVEELLKKIPGIEVDINGNIKAMGVDVDKVLVDGKEFFGKDTKIASKNLPADAVDKVQVFDKKSDQTEFSGIDDGVRDRTINLDLDENVKIGAFGNISVGVGHDQIIKENGDEVKHYQVSGKIYRFSNNTQQALLGMSNNTNEFGFSTGETTKFGDGISGLNTTHAGALNLTWNPEQFNYYNIHYLGNAGKKIIEEVNVSKNYINEDVYDSESSTNSETKSYPNNLSFKIKHRFKNHHNHYLIFEGGGSLGNGSGITNNTLRNMIGSQNISQLDANQDIVNTNLSGNLKGSYQAKFWEGKTQISIPFSTSIMDGTDGIDFENTLSYFNPESVNVVSQFQENINHTKSASVSPRISQRIAKGWYLNAVLNVSAGQDGLNRQLGYLTNDGKSKIDSLSPDFIHNEKTLSPEFSVQWSNSRHRLNLLVKGAWNEIDNTLSGISLGKSIYFNPLGGIFWEFEPRPNRRIKINYMGYNTLPTLNQLLPVANTLNPMSVYIGNSNLQPSINHRFRTELSIFDQFSFTSVFFTVTGLYHQNAMSTSRTIGKNFEQTITPINVKDAFTLIGTIDFSTPIKPIGVKIHFRYKPNWNQSSNIINSTVNDVNSLTHTFNTSIENRFKDRVDVKLGTLISLTNTKYSIQDQYNNKYSTRKMYGDIRYELNDHWHLWFKSSIQTYNSKSFNETLTYPLLHASVSYTFLEGGKASILLEGIDLLDKNDGYSQISDINYMAVKTSNTIGRLVMLTFKYRFNQVGADF